MTQQDLDYRKIHAVVPQLDFFNGGYDNIVAPPVNYSQYAAMKGVVKANGGKIASGLFGVIECTSHLASGDFWYGLGKIGASGIKAATGVVDPNYLGTNQVICQAIQEWEADSWKYRYFLSDFVPAEGKIGDIVCEDGEFDEFYCGLGHRIFDNGDYFEGMFVDGRMQKGIYIFTNGARYLGGFDENRNFTGLGTLLYADGVVYFGGFVDSLRSGVGACWYKNGAYVGQWSNNLRHGDGFYRDINGKFYDGQFENDQMIGTYE